MSGRTFPPGWSGTSTSSRFSPWPPSREAERQRLLAAVAASAMAHVLALLLPLLGERQAEFRFALRGVDHISHRINARIVKEGAHRFGTVATQGESAAQSSVSGSTTREAPRPEQPATSGAGLAPVPSIPYYATAQLTRRPQPIERAELEAPEIRSIVASGKIVLALWISDRGKVDRIDIESSTLPASFTRSAVKNFSRMRFVPGELRGRPVGSVLRIEVNYEDGRELPK